MIGDQVGNGLSVSGRSRATAVDLVCYACQLVSHTVCYVCSENQQQQISKNQKLHYQNFDCFQLRLGLVFLVLFGCFQYLGTPVVMATRNLSKAHETRESL